MLDNLLSKYAKLAIIKGVNIQKDGLLVINSPIECSNFARLLADEAYKYGASDVVINYNDEKFNKIRFNNSSKEILSITPKFEKDKYDYYVENNAAFLSISASDPDIFKDVDSDKISAYQKGRRAALEKYHSACTSNKNAWCIVSIPTENWAKKVFSESNSCEAIEKLWDAIFTVMRLKESDPIDAWNKHTKLLHDKVLELNSYKFKYLHFTNSLGTDLKIGLVQDHIWCGGEDITQDGLRFIANMPTEEVYTTPKLDDVNGIVFSSKPLSYCGNLINNFSLTFKNFLRLLEEHYREPRDVSFYAEKLFMTTRNLNLICQDILHQSVSEIIENRKLTEAKNQLISTDKTISEIGYDIGFKEKTYFTHAFKRKTGITPSEFRKDISKFFS